MEHKHPVHDTDTHFFINPITKEIENKSGKSNLIQYDHNSERFSFEIPKEVEGHDMMLCNEVQVHYINIDSSTKAQNPGVYPVNDMQVSPEDENVVVLTWLISNNATQYAGTLNFLVKFKCIADNGKVEYVWNSGIFKGITVSNGMDNGEAIVKEYPDILAEWEARIEALEENGGATDDQIAKAVSDYLAKKPVAVGSTATIGTVNLLAANWVGGANLYSQVVAIDGVTENSQVDLTPSVEQLVIFYEKDLTFVTENEDGVVTVYAIGQKPTNDYAIQVTITEVNV